MDDLARIHPVRDLLSKVMPRRGDLEKLQQIAPDVYQENLSFSITDAKLKKLPNKEDVESCLTVEKKPVAGVKITVVKNK